MVVGDQGTGTEDIAGLNRFVAGIAIPAELHDALEQAEHAVARFTGVEDGLPRSDGLNFALAGQGSHGVESIHGGSIAVGCSVSSIRPAVVVIGGLRLNG